MAHGITSYDKQQGVTQAWHRLTEIDENLGIDNNWLTQWDVVKTPLYIRHPEGGFEIVPGQYILTATDNEMMIGKPFGDTYSPITNAQFMELVKNTINASHGTTQLVSCGSVNERGRVFVSLKIDGYESFTAGGREFKEYMNFGNSFDQSSALWVNNSNVCVVCDNTFTYNMNECGNEIFKRIRHTGDIVEKLKNLSGAIDCFIKNQEVFKQKFNELAEIKVTDEFADNVFAGWLVNNEQIENKSISASAVYAIKNMQNLYRNGRGNGRQTLADMFSAVTDHYTHTEYGRNRFSTNRAYYSDFGLGSRRKQEFWGMVNNDGYKIVLDNIAERGHRANELILNAA